MSSMEFDPEELREYIEQMSDDEVLNLAMSMIEEYRQQENDEDYEVNPGQMRKFVQAYTLMQGFIGDDGKIETHVVPKERVGGITAKFNLLWLTWEEVTRFATMLIGVCALSIDATLDGVVEFSFNIPDVYRKKKQD